MLHRNTNLIQSIRAFVEDYCPKQPDEDFQAEEHVLTEPKLWRELILDILVEELEFMPIVGYKRGKKMYGLRSLFKIDRGFNNIGSALQMRLPLYGCRARKLVCEALDMIVRECVSKPTDENRAVLCAALRFAGFGISAYLLESIAQDSMFSYEVRALAACAIAADNNYRNGVPARFWKSLNPDFLAYQLGILSNGNPRKALNVLMSLGTNSECPAPNAEQYRRLRDQLRCIHVGLMGEGWLQARTHNGEFSRLPYWVRDMFAEFEHPTFLPHCR